MKNNTDIYSLLSILSIILGVLSWFTGCLCGIGIAFGIVAIVLGAISRKEARKTATVGIVFGAIGILLSILLIVGCDVIGELRKDETEQISESEISMTESEDFSEGELITPTPTPTPDKSVYYSTNDKDMAEKGNTGKFAYASKGGQYTIYYIIDFDNGYTYRFTSDSSYGDKVKIESGDLNSVCIITYHDGSDVWSYGLCFKYKNQPEHMILQESDGYTVDFYATDYDDAVKKKNGVSFTEY